MTTTETEEEELPVWARREVVRQLERQDGVDLPFGVYLLASALVAIAAVSPPRRAENTGWRVSTAAQCQLFAAGSYPTAAYLKDVDGADNWLPCRWAPSLSLRTRMQSLAPCPPAAHCMHPFC